MGLQIITQPSGGLAWSRNPSKLSIIKRGLISTAGTYACYLLVINDSDRPTPGQTLILSWTGEQITFEYAILNPSDPCYMTAWSGALASAAAANVRDLLRNPTLSQYFSVTLISATGGYAKILIQALNKGSYYNLTVGGTMPIDGSSTNTAGIDEVMPDDYALNALVELTVNKMTEPKLSGQLSLSAVGTYDEANDRMQLDIYDIKEIGRGLIKPLLPFNAFSPYMQPMAIAYVKMVLQEYYNGQSWKSEVDSFSDINGYIQMRIMNGGIALVNYPPNVPAGMSGTATATYLTSQPRTKIIDLNQPEWLSIYLPMTNGTGDEWKALFTINYTDGSTGTKTVAITEYSLIDGIYTIPTGWIQCNLGAVTPAKVATSYTVTIIDSLHSSAFSEVMTYAIDTRYFRQVRYFLVANSLGGFDTFRTVGNNQLSGKYTRSTTGIAEDIYTRSSDGTMLMVLNEEEQVWTMRSGWLMSKQDAEYYRELLMSTYVAEILTPLIPSSGNTVYKQIFRSLIVQPASLNFYEDLDSKWSVEWKMNYANREINYSALAPATEPYFDSTIEITVIPLSSSVAVSSTAANVQYKINGVVTVPSGGILPMTPFLENHIVVSGLQLGGLYFTAAGSFDAIEINRIASATLEIFSVSGFASVKSDYLVQRLPTLYNLTQLTIVTSDTTYFSADQVLIAALQLYQGGLYRFSALSLAASTPSSLGYAAKGALSAAGISVNTL